MTLQKIREFVLFVDTNAIHTPNDFLSADNLLPQTFSDEWTALSKQGNVKLVIPDVVFFELAYQKQLHFIEPLQHLRPATERIETVLGLTANLPSNESIKAAVIKTLETA